MDKKNIFLILGSVVILGLFWGLAVGLLFYRENSEWGEVCFAQGCFRVELADNYLKRKAGLMFRKSIGSNEGMFFIFDDEKEHPFWMKNTLIPLDIIWVNGKKEVVFIKKKAQPCTQGVCETIRPGKESRYVLEINAGLAEEMGIEVGDKLIFKKN